MFGRGVKIKEPVLKDDFMSWGFLFGGGFNQSIAEDSYISKGQEKTQ